MLDSTYSLAGIARLTRRRAREGHLPALRQFAEMVVLRAFYGLGPRYYHSARFFRREMSWRDKTRYLNPIDFAKAVRMINPPEYRKLSQYKLAEKSILQTLGFPTSPFIGYLNPQRGCSAEGRDLRNSDELRDCLGTLEPGNRICFKLLEGWGSGFVAAEVAVNDENQLQLRQLQEPSWHSVNDFCSQILKLRDDSEYVIEHYLEQHPWYAELNPSSVNTWRLWVLQKPGQEAEVMGAYIRIGRAGSLVDNTSSGGAAFPIDVSTGLMLKGTLAALDQDRFENHPDTGKRITGVAPPMWADVEQLAVRTVRIFPKMSFAGLDVAVTTTGPVIVEINNQPDLVGAITVDRPHRDMLGLD